MNKENKSLNICLRVMIILTWLMSNVSAVAMMTGLKNIKTDGLDADNVGERVLEVLGDFGSNTTLYYVTLGMLAVCLALAIMTRYKAKMSSYIAKIVFFSYSLISMISGLKYVGVLRSLKGISGLVINGTGKEEVQAALASSTFSGDASKAAEILVDKEALSNALSGYFLPIFILFVLVITSIHCLVKRKDPNGIAYNNNSEE